MVPELRYLDNSVPAGGDDKRVGNVRGELHAADPLGVGVGAADGGLALSESVPQLQGAVAGSRDDLSVVGRESDREDILLVTNEALGGGSALQVPESQGAIYINQQEFQ
jgi:hypothetical protein